MQLNSITLIWPALVGTLALFSACTSIPANEYRVAPVVQQPDELGKLAVGTIQSSTQLQQEEHRRPFHEGLPPGIFPSTSAAATIAAKKPDSVYRYLVALKTGETRTFESANFFKAGECIAIRMVRAGKGTEIISAIPGSCD